MGMGQYTCTEVLQLLANVAGTSLECTEAAFPSPRLGWVLRELIKATIAMPGEVIPAVVYAAALLVFELGDLKVVDAAALQGKLFEDFIEIPIYCIVSSSRGFCSVTTGSFGL